MLEVPVVAGRHLARLHHEVADDDFALVGGILGAVHDTAGETFATDVNEDVPRPSRLGLLLPAEEPLEPPDHVRPQRLWRGTEKLLGGVVERSNPVRVPDDRGTVVDLDLHQLGSTELGRDDRAFVNSGVDVDRNAGRFCVHDLIRLRCRSSERQRLFSCPEFKIVR